jgi:hypothetical protein
LTDDEKFMRDFLKNAKGRLTGRQQEVCDTFTGKDMSSNEKAEVRLALAKLDRVCVSKVACSNTHTLAVSDVTIIGYEHGLCLFLGRE